MAQSNGQMSSEADEIGRRLILQQQKQPVLHMKTTTVCPGTVCFWLNSSVYCSSDLILTPFGAREKKKNSDATEQLQNLLLQQQKQFEQNKLIEIIQNMNLQRLTASSNPTITELILSEFKFDPLNGITFDSVQKVWFLYGISTHSVI